MKRHATLDLFLVMAMALTPLASLAQESLVPVKEPEEVKKKDGWDFLLTPSLNTALSDNRKVIGQPVGTSMTIGGNIDAGTALRLDVHEWRNTLKITEQFTRTPVLDEFVKSTDIFKLESIYLIHLIEWLGPFVQVKLDAAMIEGYDARPDPVTWSIAYNDGSTVTRSGYHLRLNDYFSPLTLKETAGFFAKPFADEAYTLEFRLGFGGLHTVADGQLAIKDDGATPRSR